MGSQLAPVRRTTRSGEVADRLSETIRAGVFAPSYRLPAERELGIQFGVGRTSVREAMRMRQATGVANRLLIESKRAGLGAPGRPPRVLAKYRAIHDAAMPMPRNTPSATTSWRSGPIWVWATRPNEMRRAGATHTGSIPC